MFMHGVSCLAPIIYVLSVLLSHYHLFNILFLGCRETIAYALVNIIDLKSCLYLRLDDSVSSE